MIWGLNSLQRFGRWWNLRDALPTPFLHFVVIKFFLSLVSFLVLLILLFVSGNDPSGVDKSPQSPPVPVDVGRSSSVPVPDQPGAY